MKISQMRRGDVGYATPWEVYPGYINPDVEIDAESGGTVCVKVVCIKPGSYSISSVDPKYTKTFEEWR